MTAQANEGGLAGSLENLFEQVAEEGRLLSRQMLLASGRPTGDGQFDLAFLLSQGAEAAFAQLSEAQCDRLRRKIEVARKIFGTYEPDLSRPSSGAPLSADAMNQLCALMLLIALRRKDARYLNSALKLIDGVVEPAGIAVSERLISLTHAVLDLLLPLERRAS